MAQEISKAAASARSMLHEKVRQLRTAPKDCKHASTVKTKEHTTAFTSVELQSAQGRSEASIATETVTASSTRQPVSAEKRAEIPKEGDMVSVPSLNKKALVLKVEPSKGEIIVRANNMKLKLKLVDVN